ncbi:MAG: roadblock/LC7 domain-containing protein [Promethearchaeota archaeon]
MVSRLELILKELNENGNFRASLFSTNTGLVIASQKSEDIDDRVVAAMGSLLSDAAYAASREMGLGSEDVSDMVEMKIKYKEDYIVCRNLTMSDGKTQFTLAILTKLPESDEVEKYFDQLLDWAEENARPDLEKLASI